MMAMLFVRWCELGRCWVYCDGDCGLCYTMEEGE